MPSKRPPISYRPGDEMQRWLAGREQLRRENRSASQAARDELLMFRDLSEAELALHTWTLDELGLLTETLDGLAPDLVATAQVAGALAARPDRDNIEVAGLAERVGELSLSADKALSYAVAAHRARRLTDDREGWAQVGVRVR